MFETIIVGHDDTERSSGAVELGRALSRLGGARLIVACAYPSHPVPTVLIASPFERGSRDAAERAVSAVREAIGSAAGVEVRAVPGVTAAAALHELAVHERAHLIVVGRSHRAGIAGVAVDRVSEHVLHNSPCAVAVVPPGGTKAPLANIAVAYDGSEAARTALALARGLAEARRSPVRHLDLLLIADVEPGYHLEPRDPGLFVKGPNPVAEWLQQEAREPAGRATVRVVQRPGDPATELATMSPDFDLLIMGSRDRASLPRMLLGSVSSQLVRDACCPILVVPRGVAHERMSTGLETAVRE